MHEPEWVGSFYFDLGLEIAKETKLTNIHLFDCMQDSSHLSAMFLLERQHNKLESVYYWLFRYNIILILFLCIGIQNHVIKSTREAIICNPNEISELVIRYDLKKIRDNPQLEVKYFRFDKDIRET